MYKKHFHKSLISSFIRAFFVDNLWISVLTKDTNLTSTEEIIKKLARESKGKRYGNRKTQ
jgi:hypothetical protein